MSDPISAIWIGDKLQRKEEAGKLENFLTTETNALERQGREQAYVLALDAAYGEGKSWFLSRLRQQLELNHPVAFVDAWVDDANNEPLVSIMAALDLALTPFLGRKKVAEKLGNLTRAALPIMGKAVLGAGGKLLSRYIGDEFGDHAKEAVAAAAKAGSKSKDEDSPLEVGADKLVDGVTEVVDNAGKALLDQYRARQKSRETFKRNLKELAGSINRSGADPRRGPIYVIVDELDRCRPDYAISLLEEVKHLFDVPNMVFIVALHGRQLEASIKKVYGSEFNARDYLRRFFTRHYELRRLSVVELVKEYFAQAAIDVAKFSAPQVWLSNQIREMPADEMAGLLLSEWGATPRETIAIVDALRLFIANWEYTKTPIELPLVLVMVFQLARGDDLKPDIVAAHRDHVTFAIPDNNPVHGNGMGRFNSQLLMQGYSMAIPNNLPQIVKNNVENGVQGYATMRMSNEFAIRFNNSHQPGDPPMSSWAEYRDRVKELYRYFDFSTINDPKP